MEKLKELIRDIPDFPKKGILYRDISTLLKDKIGYKNSIDELYKRYKDEKIDYIVGVEARGFLFGTPLAYLLGIGFIPARKPGKLPSQTESIEYDLEYGTDSIEIHKDAFEKGSNILIVDDLLATGGTASAVIKLVEKLGGNVKEIAFLIELTGLGGKEKLKGHDVYSMLKY
ncbi:MAG: adenine phosphoribosyltransferase [Fusobacteriota bacterium]